MKPSIEKIRKVYSYDPVKGCLVRIASSRSDFLGPVKPRLQTWFDGKLYITAHVIWAVHFGYWPTKLIDHRDGDKLNFKLDNLREASHQENQFNKVGFGMYPKGVVFKPDGRRRPYAAVARINGVKRTLGHFATAELAGEHYRKFAETYQGEFALHKSVGEP